MSKKTVDPVLGEVGEHFVFVQYDMHVEGGEIRAGQEDCDYPNRETEYKTHTLIGVFTENVDQPRYIHYSGKTETDFEPKPGAAVHLVLVTYQTGDTFGHSTGNVSIVGVFATNAEADETARSSFGGDTAIALAAYNWGPAHIAGRIKRGKALPVVYPGKILSNIYALNTS